MSYRYITSVSRQITIRASIQWHFKVVSVANFTRRGRIPSDARHGVKKDTPHSEHLTSIYKASIQTKYKIMYNKTKQALNYATEVIKVLKFPYQHVPFRTFTRKKISHVIKSAKLAWDGKVKLSLCLTKYHTMKTHSYLTLHAMKTYLGE
jgi:hypothetical protein